LTRADKRGDRAAERFGPTQKAITDIHFGGGFQREARDSTTLQDEDRSASTVYAVSSHGA